MSFTTLCETALIVVIHCATKHGTCVGNTGHYEPRVCGSKFLFSHAWRCFD